MAATNNEYTADRYDLRNRCDLRATTFLVGLFCAHLQGSRVLFQSSSDVGPADPDGSFLIPHV